MGLKAFNTPQFSALSSLAVLIHPLFLQFYGWLGGSNSITKVLEADVYSHCVQYNTELNGKFSQITYTVLHSFNTIVVKRASWTVNPVVSKEKSHVMYCDSQLPK